MDKIEKMNKKANFPEFCSTVAQLGFPKVVVTSENGKHAIWRPR